MSGIIRSHVALALAALLFVAGCGRQTPTAPVALGHPTSVSGDGDTRPAAHDVSGAVHLEGALGPGALYSLDKPADWNGDLVIYLHGYTTPGLPVALPNNGAVRDRLLAAGFAVAASSFSENGYAVPEAMRQSHQLRGLFVSRVQNPKRVFLFGEIGRASCRERV